MMNLTTKQIKERGWTDTGIKKFLGSPDETREIKSRYGWCTAFYYDPTRVDAVEKTTEFQAFQAKSVSRKAGARKAVLTKQAQLAALVEAWEPQIQVLPADRLLNEAIRAYNCRSENSASPSCDQRFLNRITYNYVRHNLSDYEDYLVILAGKVGTHDAYQDLRDVLDDAITDVYPDLYEAAQEAKERRQSMVAA